MYDWLIVGAGFAGSVLAERLASQRGERVPLGRGVGLFARDAGHSPLARYASAFHGPTGHHPGRISGAPRERSAATSS